MPEENKHAPNHVCDHTCHCTCDHLHDQRHEHLHAAQGEEPAVCSFSKMLVFKSNIAGKDLSGALKRCLAELKQWVAENKFFIGHIKVFVEKDGKANLWLATTGKAINVTSAETWDYTEGTQYNLHMTAIVFGPREHVLQAIINEFINKHLLELGADSST